MKGPVDHSNSEGIKDTREIGLPGGAKKVSAGENMPLRGVRGKSILFSFKALKTGAIVDIETMYHC
ncbi:hypothetical protein RJ639_022136 [Escallonia herrerae]|uniref:Uncharacterized protein n=1 Tax=Escallonia herrerae TaxID=1293975 RepID=A0AA88V4Z9_9ASTE|nr:hypothetical protein RJ639_022136 [Escallonia herrerae]